MSKPAARRVTKAELEARAAPAMDEAADQAPPPSLFVPAVELNLDLIDPDVSQPRKFFDERKLAELADSIAAQGVTQPILARFGEGGRYTIVYGERRWRAARLAGLYKIPCVLRQMSEAEAAELQLVENNQRDNFRPLEESYGFLRVLTLKPALTPAELGARLGHDTRYVAQRLQLQSLVAEAAEKLQREEITFGHALLLAKLPPQLQTEALQACFTRNWRTDVDELRTIADTRQHIEREFLLRLSTAPWAMDDAALCPAAGACAACPKRSGANPLLFDEEVKQDDTCLDRECFHAKKQAWLARQKEEAGATVFISVEYRASEGALSKTRYYALPEKEKPCEYAETGTLVDGASLGDSLLICRSDDCAKHKPKHHSYGRNVPTPKEREKRRTELAESRIVGETRRRLLADIAEGRSSASDTTRRALELGGFAAFHAANAWREAQTAFGFAKTDSHWDEANERAIAALDDDCLCRFVVYCHVVDKGAASTGSPEFSRTGFAKAVGELGLDWAAVESQVRAEAAGQKKQPKANPHKCQRCQARIIWATHQRTGKPAPLNPKPDANGNLFYDVGSATYQVLTGTALAMAKENGRNLYLNHHATCKKNDA